MFLAHYQIIVHITKTCENKRAIKTNLLSTMHKSISDKYIFINKLPYELIPRQMFYTKALNPTINSNYAHTNCPSAHVQHM